MYKVEMGGIPSIFLFSALAAVLSLVGFVVVRKVMKPIDLDEHQQFLDAMLNIVGTLVSILLGLLVAAALDRYQALEDSVDSEASSVSEVFRLTPGLHGEVQARLRKSCFDYANLVVNDEWPLMAKGQVSDKVFFVYCRMVTEVSRFIPDNDGESNLHQALLTAVQEIGDCRRKRILALHSNWTKQLMPLLIMCSAIVLAFAYLYIRRGELFHAVLIGFVALSLGGNLGLVFLLNNPYAGDWKIQPRGFLFNLQLWDRLQHDPELQKLINEPAAPKEIKVEKGKDAKSAGKDDKDDDDADDK